MSKPSKTRKLMPGDRLVTLAELQFFANAVDARIAQEIAKLRAEMQPEAYPGAYIPGSEHAPATVPTDSEGAE